VFSTQIASNRFPIVPVLSSRQDPLARRDHGEATSVQRLQFMAWLSPEQLNPMRRAQGLHSERMGQSFRIQDPERIEDPLSPHEPELSGPI